MEEQDLKFFKDLLSRCLDDLLREADDTVVGLKESQAQFSDPLDRAAFDTVHNFKLHIRGRESILINKIKRSLDDIQNSDYGICENCSREISIERLKARPVARSCIRCKTEQEELEQKAGG